MAARAPSKARVVTTRAESKSPLCSPQFASYFDPHPSRFFAPFVFLILLFGNGYSSRFRIKLVLQLCNHNRRDSVPNNICECSRHGQKSIHSKHERKSL